MSGSITVDDDRGQSNVVGVAILIGLTMLSLGALTAAVGTVVDGNAAAVDADRVAADLDDAIQPTEATGHHEGRVSFTGGELRTTERTLRVSQNGSVVASSEVDGLVYETGEYRVLAVAGAVVRDHGGSTSMYADPPFAVSESVVLVGAAELVFDGHRSVGGQHRSGGSAGDRPPAGGTTVTVATDVSHDRKELGEGSFAIAVETDAPGAWERYFDRAGADEIERRAFEGDTHESVVARFEGDRAGYLVVHELDLEVRYG